MEQILSKPDQQKTLRSVSFENGFHFTGENGVYTGITATNLMDFSAKLETIDIKSVLFHYPRGDFLGAEAVQFLKLYLANRRKGTRKVPPETLTQETPLFRDENTRRVKSIGSKQLRKRVHDLYIQAGLIKQKRGRMFDLRVHSLRKFFKTQMLALGVQPDYVDYMMGHTVDTYHDIQSLGIDKLRNVYAAAGLSIIPKTKVSKVEALKEIIRAWGMNPEQLLAKDALAEGAITRVNPADMENHQLVVLSNQLRELIRHETTG